MGEYKKQHYVPQIYLRRFTPDGNRLYVFDKLHPDSARRIRPSSVREVAHENDFYDIVPEVLKPTFRPGHNRKMIENLLGRFGAEMGAATTARLSSRLRPGRSSTVKHRRY